MTSKQALAKQEQNYRRESKTCSNCIHYKSEFIKTGHWIDEKNKRCGIGNFVVKKTAVCDLWQEVKNTDG